MNVALVCNAWRDFLKVVHRLAIDWLAVDPPAVTCYPVTGISPVPSYLRHTQLPAWKTPKYTPIIIFLEIRWIFSAILCYFTTDL